jgi:hypothetical protein
LKSLAKAHDDDDRYGSATERTAKAEGADLNIACAPKPDE